MDPYNIGKEVDEYETHRVKKSVFQPQIDNHHSFLKQLNEGYENDIADLESELEQHKVIAI